MIEPRMAKQTAADERRARAAVKERDRGLCVRCGVAADNFDHRKLRSQGGRWDPSNGQLLCGTGTTGCHGWKHASPSASMLEGFTAPSWSRPEWWPAWRFDVGSWVLYFDTPDTDGRWWTEITETTAGLLMRGEPTAMTTKEAK